MKKNLLNEINQMKFLFGYKPGRVLSEQETPEIEEGFREIEFDEPEMAEGFDFDMDDEDFYPSYDSSGEFKGMSKLMGDMDIDFGPEVAEPAIAPDVKPDVKPDTDKPAPRIRPDRDPSRLPNPNPDTHPQGRGRHMDENIYEIEIDGDIEELFDK